MSVPLCTFEFGAYKFYFVDKARADAMGGGAAI